MSDVVIGEGKLSGRGVYATRDFNRGEVVMYYNLEELNQTEFGALPKPEHKFVHSYWAKMYLYPEPARYTNHSPSPNTRADFKRMCDVAIKPIKKGEMITTNATDEIKFELTTFMQAYEKAANSRNFSNVAPLIADNAVFVFTDGTFVGKPSIQKAFEDTWNKIQNEKYLIGNLKWIKIGYRNAACEYEFESDGVENGYRQVYKGRGTNTLKRIDGNWRVVNEHLVKI